MEILMNPLFLIYLVVLGGSAFVLQMKIQIDDLELPEKILVFCLGGSIVCLYTLFFYLGLN